MAKILTQPEAEKLYQDSLAQLDVLTAEQVEALVLDLSLAGKRGLGQGLRGRWRQRRSQMRQLARETGTSGSSSPPSSAPTGGNSSATS